MRYKESERERGGGGEGGEGEGTDRGTREGWGGRGSVGGWRSENTAPRNQSKAIWHKGIPERLNVHNKYCAAYVMLPCITIAILIISIVL